MTERRIVDGSDWKPADDEGGYGLITGERLLPAMQIFKKPWFGRVWVLQEVGLAREVLLAYGRSSINFTEIMDFAQAWAQTGNDFPGVYFSSGLISGLFNHVWATIAGGEPSLDGSAQAEDADAHRLATEAALLNRPSIAEEYWALLEATERSHNLAYADKALAFASTLLHACDADDKDPASIARSFSDFCKEHCPTIQDRLEKHEWLNQWASAETHFIPFVPRTASSIKGERFFTTKKGYCGTSTPLIKPGDLICIIPSVQTPLMIRPVEGRDGVFHIIGSSYVCGMMYGEVFKTPKPGHSSPEVSIAQFL
ncbi:hypothetical protein KHU50_006232 [Colletotrichum sp. SAR 10_65]|nr:hypothetical protein K4K51_003933 [Colletotrichum sp. SAR 10_75]KAI8208292.1 hypothetical protein KHU50_006232 [Colletotrichum sp. SAR 10_65]